MTAEEISSVIRDSEAVFSTPNEHAKFYHEPGREGVSIPASIGIEGLVIDSENQICVAPAGMYLVHLQKQLLEAGLCLPYPILDPSEGAGQASTRGGMEATTSTIHVSRFSIQDGVDVASGSERPKTSSGALEGNFRYAEGMMDRLSIRQAIDLNLPHAAEAQRGNWRDWIIGMTVVLGDGMIAKSGSQAVKNVAGYDAHKLFIGARGTLGIISEVILRVQPAGARICPDVEWGPYRATGPVMIHRVLPSDYAMARDLAGDDLILGDQATGTVWRRKGKVERYPNDWLIESGNLHLAAGPLSGFYDRAKDLFDPEKKLNPGLMGTW